MITVDEDVLQYVINVGFSKQKKQVLLYYI